MVDTIIIYCTTKLISSLLLISSFRYFSLALNFPISRRQYTRLHCNLHRSWFTSHRQSLLSIVGHRGSLCRLVGDDIRRRQRSTWLLDLWGAFLRHVGRIRCHVLNCEYTQSVRDLFGQIHPHQGSTQVSKKKHIYTHTHTQKRFKCIVNMHTQTWGLLSGWERAAFTLCVFFTNILFLLFCFVLVVFPLCGVCFDRLVSPMT